MALRSAPSFLRSQLWRRAVLEGGVRPLSTSCPTLASKKEVDNQPTHTGQQFDQDDYRMVRFIDKKKHVNTKFAIDLIDEVPPKACEERVVCCDGGGGPLGHPKVYINLDQPGNHICGYCGLRFTKKEGHH